MRSKMIKAEKRRRAAKSNQTVPRLFRHRILSFIAGCLCICISGVTAYADAGAESVLTNFLENDNVLTMQIVVSGHIEAEPGTPVAFYLSNEAKEPVHYAQSELDDEGGYRFGFLLNPKYGSGAFTYEVKPKDLTAQTGTVEVVDINDMTTLLTYIQSGETSAEGLQAQMAQINPAVNLPFYNKISSEELCKILYTELSGGNTPTDEEGVYRWIRQGAVVAGVNACPNELFLNGRFLYTEQVGLDAESTELYETKLSKAGLSAVQNGLTAADYGTATECAQALRKLVLTNSITHNVSGDLDEAAANLRSYGTELGLDLSKADGKEISVVRALMNAGCGTLAELQAAYKTAVANASSVDGGNHGGSGGGGGGGFGYQPNVNPMPAIENQTTTASGFADMTEFTWAEEAVAGLKALGVINGRSETEFAPAEAVTREEFVKMVMEGFGLMTGEPENNSSKAAFADVNTQEWYAPYVLRAAALGVVTGISDEEFGIGQQISRQDMATLAFRAMRYKNSELDTDFADVSFTDTQEIAEYALAPALLLKKLNILSGYPDGSFQPLQTANRAESAQMMYRMLTLTGSIG